jgi:signal transduction histidine kinase
MRGIAHELSNPLTSVLTLAELLASEGDDGTSEAAERREAARAMRDEARRAARIVGKLNAFARQREPERARTDLNRVVLDAVELRRYALRTHDVDLRLDLEYELPVTWADPNQLQQVFLQIVTAAEHSLASVPAHERRLVVRTRRRRDRLEAAFVDTGVDGGRDHDADLAVSSELVRAHGGELRVEDARGGTAVVVALPLVAPPDADPLGTAERALVAGAAPA